MELVIKKINSRWTVNGKSFNKMTAAEKTELNDYFIDYKKSTLQRFREKQNENIKRIIGNQKKVFATMVFNEAFNNPINPPSNWLKT